VTRIEAQVGEQQRFPTGLGTAAFGLDRDENRVDGLDSTSIVSGKFRLLSQQFEGRSFYGAVLPVDSSG
jgi:hypothetical protein